MSKKWIEGKELVRLFKQNVMKSPYSDFSDHLAGLAACSGIFKDYALTWRYLENEYLRVELNYSYFFEISDLITKEVIDFFSKALNSADPVAPVCSFRLEQISHKFLMIEWYQEAEIWYQVREVLTRVDGPFIKGLIKLF